MNDEDVWNNVGINDLWVYDKLILSKYLGHTCGPAGVRLPHPGFYIVKPITNLQGMGLGTYFFNFETTDTSSISPGYFWMEIFSGPHLSVDVVDGETDVVYQGQSEGPQRFSKWTLLDVEVYHPQFIVDLSKKYHTVNYEMIGGHIIEVHLRANPDWQNHKAKQLIPIWKGDPIPENFVDDPDGDRIGFEVIK